MLKTLQGTCFELVTLAAVALFTVPSAVGQSAALTGVVRDRMGSAQLGVLVQVSAVGSDLVRRVFTDPKGRYLLSNLPPGRYEVVASEAMFAPVLKPNLLLRSGARTVVNVTLSTLFETSAWLPAERRKADEPPDDWKWTLRSAANRPILRVLDDGRMVMVAPLSSSSIRETRKATTQGRAALTGGDGGFGSGGVHHILTTDTTQDDGLGVVLRAETGQGRTQTGLGPSTAMTVGFERQTGFATMTRAVSSLQSHPEMITAGQAAGLQTLQIATAQRTRLGDTVVVEAGGMLSGLHTDGYAFAAQPFLRVVAGPVAGWSMGYRMATSRDLQGYASLDGIQPELPLTASVNGHLKTEQGKHQEVSVARELGRGQARLTAYEDRLRTASLAGSGSLAQADFAALDGSSGAIADRLTDEFRLLVPGFEAQGLNLMVTQPLGAGMWAALECSTGRALEAVATADKPASLATLTGGLRSRRGVAAAIAVNGRLPDTGTRVRAVYRWQRPGMLTPIDSFREFTDQEYLSFQVRQALRWEGVLPPGLEASVDVTNLLAQGYLPFTSTDGRTLFVSQSPRMLQAGLSLNF